MDVLACTEAQPRSTIAPSSPRCSILATVLPTVEIQSLASEAWQTMLSSSQSNTRHDPKNGQAREQIHNPSVHEALGSGSSHLPVRETPIRQGIASTPVLSVLLGATLWCMRSPCRSCDRFRHSCYPSQVTPRPRCFPSSALPSSFEVS